MLKVGSFLLPWVLIPQAWQITVGGASLAGEPGALISHVEEGLWQGRGVWGGDMDWRGISCSESSA